MSKPSLSGLCAVCWLLVCSVGIADTGEAAIPIRAEPAVLPLHFAESPNKVGYVAQGAGYTLHVLPDEIVLIPATSDGSPYRLQWVAPQMAATLSGKEDLPGRVNFLLGSDRSQWKLDCQTYARVQCEQLYPGIDVIYYGNQRRVQFDLIVAPGSDTSSILLQFDGSNQARVDAEGQLVLSDAHGVLTLAKPFVYQVVNGEQVQVDAAFVLREDGLIGFALGEYDTERDLVIDPVLSYSSFLGGSGFSPSEQGSNDVVRGVGLGPNGNIYLTGYTNSIDFPVLNAATPSLPDPVAGGGLAPTSSAFLTILSPDGASLLYSTYFGGNETDKAYALAVDPAGNAYITGETFSNNFPASAGAFQTDLRGGQDAFVAKFDATGALLFATLLGGIGDSVGYDIAADESGAAYVVGYSESDYTIGGVDPAVGYFPRVNPILPEPLGADEQFSDRDAFLTKISADGSSLIYSTLIGGSAWDEARGVAVSSTGEAYVVGSTVSMDLPSVGAYQASYAGPNDETSQGDAFVARVAASGSSLVYASYLGGNERETANGVALDAAGNLYVVGSTLSANFPTQGSLHTHNHGETVFYNDAFVTKLSADGASLIYSTYMGGVAGDVARRIAIDDLGRAHVVGHSALISEFPGVAMINGSSDSSSSYAYIAQISEDGSAANYSAMFGGLFGQTAYDLAIGPDRKVYVAGSTEADDFPTYNPYQPLKLNGGNTGFLLILSDTNNTGSDELSATGVRPASGGNDGIVTLSVFGSGFESGATLVLRRGEVEMIPEHTQADASGDTLVANIDLTGSELGEWDVVVTNPDGESLTFSSAFTVEPSMGYDIKLDLIGRETIAVGREHRFAVLVENAGNVDAFGIPVWVSGIPLDAEVALAFELARPNLPPEWDPDEFDAMVPLTVERDGHQDMPFLVSRLAAGEKVTLTFIITAGSQTEFALTAWADEPMSSARGMTDFAKLRNQALPALSSGCSMALLTTAADLAGALAPGGCITTSIFAGLSDILFAESAALDLMSGKSPSVFSMVGAAASDAGWVVGCAGTAIPGVGLAINSVILAMDAINVVQSCEKDFGRAKTKKSRHVRPLQSVDPNDKIGPAGSDGQHYVVGDEPFRYTILFENKPDASAPAQEVLITDQLDTSVLDISTLRFEQFTFGNTVVDLEDPNGSFTGTVNLGGDRNLIVRITASVDASTGLLSVFFESLDPATMSRPEDPLRGFLPPNQTSPEGEGSVRFVVSLHDSVESGDEIANQASIVFDVNEAILTPIWSVVVDRVPPTSSVNDLPAESIDPNFVVTWSGTDADSDVAGYTLMVAVDDGLYEAWLGDTALTSAVYEAEPGHRYTFYCVARDLAGNLEVDKFEPEAVINVPPATPIGCGTGVCGAFAASLVTLSLAGAARSWKRHR